MSTVKIFCMVLLLASVPLWAKDMVDRTAMAPVPNPGVPTLGSGGPDGGGYYWRDSNGGGIQYNWVEHPGNASAVSGVDDGYSGPYNLGFNFNFYGTNYSQCYISWNGRTTFGNGYGGYAGAYPGNGLPAGAYNLPADLCTYAGGVWYFWQSGTRFYVEGLGVQYYYSSGASNFELWFDGSDNSITFQYQSCNPSYPWTYYSGTYYNWGIQNNGFTGTNGWSFPKSQISNGYAVQFYKQVAQAGDLGVVSVTSPGVYSTPAMNTGQIADTVYTGLAYTPACSVKNFSGTTMNTMALTTGTCNLRITEPSTATYTDVVTTPDIPNGATRLVTFNNNWTVGRKAGLTYTITDSAFATPDRDPANDKMTKTVFAKGDVAAVDGTEPTGEVYVNQLYNPAGKIQNMTPGYTELFPITCQIIDEGGAIIYTKTRTDTLGPNEVKALAFDDWKVPATVGAVYEIDIKTALPGDCNPTNDLYQWYVTAVAQPGIDVGTDTILIPLASVKQGETFKTKAVVHNYGTNAASFDVRCIINNDTLPIKSVVSLAKDANQEVVFDDWSTANPGQVDMKVYTMLPGDGNPVNDTFKWSFTVTGVNETGKPKPTAYALGAARPNPTSSWTDISYSLPENTSATVAVYDVTGKLVKTLAAGFDVAGCKQVRWDGRDGSGKTVPNGLYFVRFETPRYAATGKLVLTR